jgi:hypothetical protein
MIWEVGRRARHGDRPLVVTVLNLVAALALLGAFLCTTTLDGSAQEARPQATSPRDPLVNQALRALGRGLAERAKELGDPLATGSLGGPVPRFWTIPVPLPQTVATPITSPVTAGQDLGRLFDPRPLGTPAPLNIAEQKEQRQASLPDPRIAPPQTPPPLALPPAAPEPTAAVPTAPAPTQAEPARRQEPQATPTPPSSRAPPATAALEFPVPPAPTRPKEDMGAPAQDTRKSAPAEKPAKATPAARKTTQPRVRSVRIEEPSTESEADEARPVPRRSAPKRAVRVPPVGQPDVTGSIGRSSSRAALRDTSGRSERTDATRPLRAARQQPSDISIIELPASLRPTRPPAGSPL